jgi:hypothetical protein
MNMDLVKELGDYLSGMAPEAIVRYGDYPRGANALKITVILSRLKDVERVRQYYDKMPLLIQEEGRKQQDIEAKLRELIDASTAVPSLL